MAKWRALHGSISTSEQVNRLTEFAQLLFTWMIPHADDWGILTGSPLGIRMKVIPGTNRSLEEIEEALTNIEHAGLIWRYEADGHGQLVQFRTWAGYQPIRADRQAPPKYPEHDGLMPGDGGPDDNQRLSNDGLQDITRQDITQQDRQDTTSSDTAGDVDDVSEALLNSNLFSLDQLGINEPKRSELAALPYVNETYLEAWAAYLGKQAAKGNKLGQGFLVRQIEANAHPWADP